MQNQIEELRAKIKKAQKESEALTLERQRLESLRLIAQAASDTTTSAIVAAQEEFSRISIQQPGTPEGQAAYTRLMDAREQGQAAREQLGMMEQAIRALAATVQEARIQAEISGYRNLMWGAVQDAELARLGADCHQTIRQAFAAGMLFSGGAFGTLRNFAGQHMAVQPPNPDELREMQDSLRRKYKF